MVAGEEMTDAVDAEAMEAEDSLSAEQLEELNCLALTNLFIKEDGSPVNFYMRKSRLDGRPDKVELTTKLENLVTEAQVSGYYFRSFPTLGYFYVCLSFRNMEQLWNWNLPVPIPSRLPSQKFLHLLMTQIVMFLMQDTSLSALKKRDSLI